jgi:hypothetical protein
LKIEIKKGLQLWRVMRSVSAARFAISRRILHTQPEALSLHVVNAIADLPTLYRNDDIVTVDTGALTVSLLIHDSAMVKKSAIMPGFDHRGRAGWMLLTPGESPFFTRAHTLGAALDERATGEQLREQIHTQFGSGDELRSAVASVSVWQIVPLHTILSTRIGAWEAEHALRRAGLWWIAKRRNGLPAWALRRCGELGVYAIANTLLAPTPATTIAGASAANRTGVPMPKGYIARAEPPGRLSQSRSIAKPKLARQRTITPLAKVKPAPEIRRVAA